jgi:plasmid replication initiation protein
VRLYELLMQFKSVGWRTISIEELRAAFGIGPTQYKLIAQFKRNTVDVAVAQINDLSEWKVTYQNHKHGVKITGLTFNIRKKPVPAPKPKAPKPVMTDDYVQRHARPGESWDAARDRLQKAWDAGTNYDQQTEFPGMTP